ncbi:hypothetical protein FRX31_003804 [Thalictrum thalictroides]|uniref:Uncharacterized protein n=1 Tax=Thalictrum thalictroides TaxID=46969 RepID=A0A7J6XDU4_THATH|nr:hypothetical protein FRX31_003804 [Thalictrum thalictroides]
MCFDQQRSMLMSDMNVSRVRSTNGNVMVEILRSRLAETESRLERARARELELSRRLDDMKRFISVMEILETYLKGVLRERQAQIMDRISLEKNKVKAFL